MIDIIDLPEGKDMVLMNTDVARAGNVLGVQIGDLEFAQGFGVDLKFFFDPTYQFQNESFKAYLVQRLLQHQINVAQVLDTIETFFTKYTFLIGNAEDNATGLIR